MITIEAGRISAIATLESESDAVFDDIGDVAIPGIPNLHSHSFQRGFAGLSEFRTAEHDSFWTWRKLMYDFVWKLTPEDRAEIDRIFAEEKVPTYVDAKQAV